MNASSKLLTTTAPLLNAACNTRAAIFLQSRKIFYMLQPTCWQQLPLENLRGNSHSKVSNSNYLEPATSMDDSSSHQKCAKAKMDSYHDTCYSQNSAPAMCDMFNNASNYNMLCHQSGTFLDNTHSVKAKVHMTDTNYESYIDKPRYKAIRKWKRIGKGRTISSSEDFFPIRLLSFNILAQNLLENHSYLYLNHIKKALMWKIRKPLVIQEIIEAEANVICLQEMQEDHLLDFIIPFKQLGYNYLYKKRTNDKTDGLLLLYRSDQFTLLEHAKVELYQSGVEVLNRDNVGIIAKFSLRDSPDTQFVVATTHLLYNPKRNDVRLAQIQVLLAEIERIAFVENSLTYQAKYLPIILSGDFNLEPFTGVYKFLTEGFFEYHGKGPSLEPSQYRLLSNSLIPSKLCVTDNCQHFNILTQRLRKEGTGAVMLENSESLQKQDEKVPTPCDTKVLERNDASVDTDHTRTIEIIQGYSAKFASGTLTHPFKMQSVYTHTNDGGEEEATTYQNRWITVDYIFHSNIRLVEKYTLPTVSQCNALRRIPNFVVGSDHLSIGATFQLRKKKSSL